MLPKGKLRLICLVAFALALSGCKPGAPKELSKAARAEVAQLVSEADFATLVREHARSEEVLRKVVKLDPASSQYWLQLGFACRRQEKLSDAKSAYKHALSVRETEFRRNKTAENLLSQIEVLALLGREGDARKVLSRAEREFADHPAVKACLEQKFIDRMLADPKFKQLAL